MQRSTILDARTNSSENRRNEGINESRLSSGVRSKGTMVVVRIEEVDATLIRGDLEERRRSVEENEGASFA